MRGWIALIALGLWAGDAAGQGCVVEGGRLRAAGAGDAALIQSQTRSVDSPMTLELEGVAYELVDSFVVEDLTMADLELVGWSNALAVFRSALHPRNTRRGVLYDPVGCEFEVYDVRERYVAFSASSRSMQLYDRTGVGGQDGRLWATALRLDGEKEIKHDRVVAYNEALYEVDCERGRVRLEQSRLKAEDGSSIHHFNWTGSTDWRTVPRSDPTAAYGWFLPVLVFACTGEAPTGARAYQTVAAARAWWEEHRHILKE